MSMSKNTKNPDYPEWTEFYIRRWPAPHPWMCEKGLIFFGTRIKKKKHLQINIHFRDQEVVHHRVWCFQHRTNTCGRRQHWVKSGMINVTAVESMGAQFLVGINVLKISNNEIHISYKVSYPPKIVQNLKNPRKVASIIQMYIIFFIFFMIEVSNHFQ